MRSDLECPLSEGPDELHALGHQVHTCAHCMVWRRCEYSTTGCLCFSRGGMLPSTVSVVAREDPRSFSRSPTQLSVKSEPLARRLFWPSA